MDIRLHHFHPPLWHRLLQWVVHVVGESAVVAAAKRENLGNIKKHVVGVVHIVGVVVVYIFVVFVQLVEHDVVHIADNT